MSNLLRLLQLPQGVQDLVLRRELQERHAQALLPLVQVAKNSEEANRLAKIAVENRQFVSELEENVAEAITQLTVEIEPVMAQFVDWESLLPQGCTTTCIKCEYAGRWKHQLRCAKPALYRQKYNAWLVRQNRTNEENTDVVTHLTDTLTTQGVRFETGKTWNAVPTPKCLRCQTTFQALRESLNNNGSDFTPQQDGTVPRFCQYLRLFPHYVEQFIPAESGPVLLEVKETDLDRYPTQSLTVNGRGVRGANVLLLSSIDAYCVASDVHQPDSCFDQQEAVMAQWAVEILTQQGLPAIMPDFIKKKKELGEFIWLEPQLKGQPCTPKTCLHRQDNPPGFGVLVQPGDKWEMVCLHAGCGGKAKEALVDRQAEQQKVERQHQQDALDKLRQLSVEKTIETQPGQGMDLSAQPVRETLEEIL